MICWQCTFSQYQTLTQQFQEVTGIPCVIGAIDGTHINIPGSSEHRDAYINRKGFPSMQLQVVCDKSMHFLDVLLDCQGLSMTVGLSTILP